MKIAIIKYNAGNIRSVLNALNRIGISAIITEDADEIRTADKVIFPGVGEARSAMNYLREKKLDRVICSLTQPVLGICLGMQLLCRHSEENDTDCLGIFQTDVKKFKIPESNRGLKVPHTGWNQLHQLQSELFRNIPEQSFMYFVHGYFAGHTPESIARTDYIIPFCSALKKDNFYGVQFHPEKSSVAGEILLKNFIGL